MKHPVRLLSVLLALVLTLSTLSGLSVLAAPTYNNGTIGKLCTALSAQAKAYYKGNYTYEKLSAQSGTTLKNSLSSLVGSNRSNVGFNGLKTKFARTDAYHGSSSQLRLFYCGLSYKSDWEGDYNFNREHMWPDSKHGNVCEGDLHSMRPTDKKLNSTRGNKPYGEVTNGTAAYAESHHNNALGGYYDGKYFEPLDAVKGDVARAIMYDHCTYPELSDLSIVFQNNTVLLSWIKLDPVDEFEMVRNDVVQDIQGCRNPFVDYPELAYKVLNVAVPADLATPSNPYPASYQVTAVSANPAYGSVSLTGSVITASPKEGYYASGYSVSPNGAAKVSQSGNIFTLSNLKSDCTVTISFAAKTPATITYIVPNGITVNGTTSAYVGETIRTATVSGVPDGYTFFGWSKSFVKDTSVQPKGWAANASYSVTTTETTFYSVFWYKADGSYRYRSDFPGECSHETTHVETIEPTCTEKGATNTVCDTCGNVLKTEEIAALGHNYTTEITKPATPTEDGVLTYTCRRCADSYTEVIPATGEECKHESTYEDIEEPTCTEAGTRTTLCNTCGAVIATEEIAALGHNYASEVTTPATEKEDGILTYTCRRCADSYTEVIPATGAHVCPSEDYTDIDTGRWYHEPIDYVLSHGLMNGMGDGIFAPDGKVTRAMLVTILYRADGQTSVEGMTHSFTDVPENVYYTDAVIWAATNGIVTGVTDTQFAPDVNITREQIATILYRYSKSEPVELALYDYTDADLISTYAQEAIRWAVANGIINGKTETTLAPLDTATRAEIAAMLSRYLTK